MEYDSLKAMVIMRIIMVRYIYFNDDKYKYLAVHKIKQLKSMVENMLEKIKYNVIMEWYEC